MVVYNLIGFIKLIVLFLVDSMSHFVEASDWSLMKDPTDIRDSSSDSSWSLRPAAEDVAMAVYPVVTLRFSVFFHSLIL